MILRFLKIILIVAVILVITISIILLLLSMQPFVPNNYTQIVKTGGELEAKYLAMGASQVEHMEVSTEEEWGNINVYYPKELTESAKSYPVVVMVNGTGVYSSKYPALFKHLASWGFIVIGNEDPSTCSGSSADTTLAWLLNENENPDSRFYQKVDEEHIGISGHSQGGVGVFNAINVRGDETGDVMFYGKGAGKLPTASAVVADVVDALKNGSKVHDSLFWQPAEPVEGMLTDPAPAAYYVRAAGVAPAVVEAIYGKGRVVDEHFDGCSYLVEQADAKAMAEAARKVETVGGSVKLVLKKLPEDA